MYLVAQETLSQPASRWLTRYRLALVLDWSVYIFRIPHFTHHSAFVSTVFDSAFYFPRSAFRNSAFYQHPVNTCPASMTSTRSQCSTVRIEWAMIISVQSHSVCRIVSFIPAAVSESNDDVASSNTTIYTITTLPYCTFLPCLVPDIKEWLRENNLRGFRAQFFTNTKSSFKQGNSAPKPWLQNSVCMNLKKHWANFAHDR